MTEAQIVIRKALPTDRESLDEILEEGFDGLYLWHAKKTLKDIEVVNVATVDGELAGLVMLKELDNTLGYVYYIAVAKRFRGTGVGGKLLDDALSYFFNRGMVEVYSSVEADNLASLRLFDSRGFRSSSLRELTKRYGLVKSNLLRVRMLLVPGELLRVKELSTKLDP
jgi:ribosomal protein S18 acetylase RimI-like enzyme